METPLEAKEHEGTSSIKEIEVVSIGPVDALAEGSPEDENLRDANQPSDIPFSKSPVDEAYQGEDHENDNYLGDTISLGSPETKMHNNYKLEGEIPPKNIVPIGNIPDDDIVQPVQVVENNAALDRGPKV